MNNNIQNSQLNNNQQSNQNTNMTNYMNAPINNNNQNNQIFGNINNQNTTPNLTNNNLNTQHVDMMNSINAPINNNNQNNQNNQIFGNINNQNTTPNLTNNNLNNQNINKTNNTINNNSTTTKKTNKNIIILVVALLILTATGFGCYWLINSNNPVTIYKNIIQTGINGIFDITLQEDEKFNSTTSLDFNIDVEEDLLDSTIIDLINKTTIELNYQMDKKNEQLLLKLDADYEQASLIDLQMFIDGKNEKEYLYLKEYYDKYLELNEEDLNTDEIFETANLGQMINSNKAKKILVKEFTSIVQSENCSKNGDSYIFEITEKELIKRIKIALQNLRDNDNFLECYEESDTIKAELDDIIKSIDEEYYYDEKIKFSITKKLISNNIDKLIINYDEEEIIFTTKENKINYQFLSSNEKVFSGYIITKKERKTDKMELLFEIPEIGKLNLNITSTYTKGKNIDKIDLTNTKSIDELTSKEQDEIMNNFEKSKLYEIIQSFVNSYNDDYNDYDYDYDYDYE